MQSTNNDQRGGLQGFSGRVIRKRIPLLLALASVTIALAIAVPRVGDSASNLDVAQASTAGTAAESFENWFLGDIGTRGPADATVTSTTSAAGTESDYDETWNPLHEGSLDEILYLVWNKSRPC